MTIFRLVYAKEVREYNPLQATGFDRRHTYPCCPFWNIDCDFDSDCAIGLVCFFREEGDGSGGAVPGCIGNAEEIETGDEDFCIARPTPNTLTSVYDDEDGGVNGQFPIGFCSGDCDEGK